MFQQLSRLVDTVDDQLLKAHDRWVNAGGRDAVAAAVTTAVAAGQVAAANARAVLAALIPGKAAPK